MSDYKRKYEECYVFECSIMLATSAVLVRCRCAWLAGHFERIFIEIVFRSILHLIFKGMPHRLCRMNGLA